MEKIEGKDLMVFVRASDGAVNVVGVSTSCTLTVTDDVQEVSWRGGAPWRRYRRGWRSWEVTVDGLLAVGNVDPLDLMNVEDGDLMVAFWTVAPHPSGEPAGGFVPDGRLLRHGYALLSSTSEAGEDGTYATRSMTFVGTGRLRHGEMPGDFDAGDFDDSFNVA